ncbi:hypothetical protein BC829DRAFT_422232 [Chytridium lagenaria]|nr:hypothetical protein BC829DRAFT_422232 [Chytridium lagenaria]
MIKTLTEKYASTINLRYARSVWSPRHVGPLIKTVLFVGGTPVWFDQDLTIRLRDLFPYGLVTPSRRKIRLFIKTLLMLPFAIFRSRPNYSFARFIPVWFGHSITAKNRLSRPNYSLARLPFGLVIPSRRNIGCHDEPSVGRNIGCSVIVQYWSKDQAGAFRSYHCSFRMVNPSW